MRSAEHEYADGSERGSVNGGRSATQSGITNCGRNYNNNDNHASTCGIRACPVGIPHVFHLYVLAWGSMLLQMSPLLQCVVAK